jgi:hypothetical protein
VTPLRAAILAEVAAVLAAHGRLACEPTLACEDGTVTLTVVVRPEQRGPAQYALDTLNLGSDLQRMCDIATMRALCARYDLDPAWLERALDPPPDDGHQTKGEG